MKAWQRRVVEEKRDLDARRGRLDEFLKSEKRSGKASDAEYDRLCRQAGAMRAYSDVLGERIGAFEGRKGGGRGRLRREDAEA